VEFSYFAGVECCLCQFRCGWMNSGFALNNCLRDHPPWIGVPMRKCQQLEGHNLVGIERLNSCLWKWDLWNLF
jgi:hypothetical protein